MKRRKNLLQIILSLFVFLFISCGIPNYFGDVGQYVTLTSTYFQIERKYFSNNFDTDQIQPKLMFLYYINSSELSHLDQDIQKLLTSEIKKQYQPSAENAILCGKKQNESILFSDITIKKDDKNYTYGIYQFIPEKFTSVSKGEIEVLNDNISNWANDFLINKNNTEIKYGTRYYFDFSLEEFSTEENEKYLVILTVSDRTGQKETTVRLKNTNNQFFSLYKIENCVDYEIENLQDPVIHVLPVLYLDSTVYSNKQMVVPSSSEWIQIPIEKT